MARFLVVSAPSQCAARTQRSDSVHLCMQVTELLCPWFCFPSPFQRVHGAGVRDARQLLRQVGRVQLRRYRPGDGHGQDRRRNNNDGGYRSQQSDDLLTTVSTI